MILVYHREEGAEKRSVINRIKIFPVKEIFKKC